MKTAKEWFEGFQEPYRSEAIDNTFTTMLTAEYTSKKQALMGSFTWANSPQHRKYWINFYNSLTGK